MYNLIKGEFSIKIQELLNKTENKGTKFFVIFSSVDCYKEYVEMYAQDFLEATKILKDLNILSKVETITTYI